ncbi:ABC transporter substrate-binding protein [Aquibacillus salsiterrae]|uniref:ABC transporter substrate-binding protein n=1 Tax=Aquibacillus salsiterrae TaxID=2950439 RepID=A0A9X4AF74_9BACI|nr:ABC transporter substrate-binding protein [Aquibacillus salsiterrae]MDC3417566.1 ABC transporter substrate-binding protein [Aquibacillus salsiterrae]
MKVCSFLPGSTSMITEMGLEDYLYGVTFECPIDRPRVVRSYLEDNHYTSEEIERVVSDSVKEGKSLYYIDIDLLKEIEPDVIFTQHVCDVCQIGTSFVQKALHQLDKKPTVIPLVPRNLDDVYDNALTIANVLGEEEAGQQLIKSIKEREQHILSELRAHNAPLRKVMIMEWMDPIYNCGHWIPYQVSIAGGVDMLSNPSGYSIITPWEKVRLYDPEVIVIAPCGFDIERASEEISRLAEKPGWNNLQAVKNNHVFLADADLFTRPSTTLIDGIEVLASLFHPSIFSLPDSAKDKVRNINS